MKPRAYNFGAGPAMLPESVLRQAQQALLQWDDTGTSILEIGHRTQDFGCLLDHAEATLRDLLSIPASYRILFLCGPARLQFATIPMNLLAPTEEACYLTTGVWSSLAFAEAQRLKKAYAISSEQKGCFRAAVKSEQVRLKKNSAYLYYTPNETINGIRFPYVPDAQGIPLIADMTSCLLSEPVDISQYALVFAGAQKNIANAGLTLVIVREDLLQKKPNPTVPTVLEYAVQAKHRSLYATPPVFNCYLAANMFDWLKAQGGVAAVYAQNCAKAEKLYAFIDASDRYHCPVDADSRSLVNVCFTLQTPALETQFLEQAKAHGLLYLQGHRTLGGLRASLYNAMPMEGVVALIDFMQAFAQENRP